MPSVILNTTINTVPAEDVPPFRPGFLPAVTDEERERDREVAAEALRVWDGALPALNVARKSQGLPPLDHVVDQARSAALVLVLTSAAFDFMGPLPPHVKHVGPRLDDMVDCGEWRPPAAGQPLVLLALSSDFQDQKDLLRRAVAAMGMLPVRGIATTGGAIEPSRLEAPPNVEVRRLAPHSRSSRTRRPPSPMAATGQPSRHWPPACRSSASRWAGISSTSPPGSCTGASASASNLRPRRS